MQSWKRRLGELAYVEPARYSTVESWARCVLSLPLREGQPTFKRVDALDLARRQEKATDLIAAARPKLERLMAEIAGETTVAYITDADGIVMLSFGNSDQMATFGLAPGFDWSERAMGTNGAGTAIVTRRPVAVVGAEHYLLAFENCTCTAAPIFDPQRDVIGALDVSSSVAEASPERLFDVITTAREIEEEIHAIADQK